MPPPNSPKPGSWTLEVVFSSISRLKAFPGAGAWRGVPEIRALYEATYFAGLRKAGMPEE
jgi:hypothetical protein